MCLFYCLKSQHSVCVRTKLEIIASSVFCKLHLQNRKVHSTSRCKRYKGKSNPFERDEKQHVCPYITETPLIEFEGYRRKKMKCWNLAEILNYIGFDNHDFICEGRGVEEKGKWVCDGRGSESALFAQISEVERFKGMNQVCIWNSRKCPEANRAPQGIGIGLKHKPSFPFYHNHALPLTTMLVKNPDRAYITLHKFSHDLIPYGTFP